MDTQQTLRNDIANATARGFVFYVYTLADEKGVFYVGKGKGLRVFAHDRCDGINIAKDARIRAAGASLQREILAFFMDGAAAYAAEAQLIDELAGLTNIARNYRPYVERAREAARTQLDALLKLTVPARLADLYHALVDDLRREIEWPCPSSMSVGSDGRAVWHCGGA